MKARFYILLFSLLLGLSSASLAQDAGAVSVKLRKATLRGQTLNLDLDVKINQLPVSSHASLALTIALKNGNNIVHLPPIVVHGSNKMNMFERKVAFRGLDSALDGAYIVLRSDKNEELYVNYTKSIAYYPWMDKCQLLLIGDVLDYNNNPVDTFTDVLVKSTPISKSGTTTKAKRSASRTKK